MSSGGKVVLVAYDSGAVPRDVSADTSGRLNINLAAVTPPSTFNHGSRTTNVGVAVPLNANLPVMEVMVTARPANTGFVYIGGPTVSAAAYGKRLSANGWVVILIDNLNRVYFDVSVNGEGVDYIYVG